MPHSSRLATIACGVGLLRSASAWLPCGVTTAARAIAGAREHRGGKRQAAALAPLKSSTRDGVERPNLAALKKGFERSMDGKLVMEYVTELRSRKALLLSLLEETRGIITEDIYPIMEDLALVNPSGGCGKGGDQGRGHYCAMLPGHWIAASTIVPNVPYVYGKGETTPAGPSPSSGGTVDGPTCTLGELVAAITGRECSGDFNPSSPVRPLRARLSALNNTVKDGEMPTVVTVAGFSPAATAVPAAAAMASSEGELEVGQEKGESGRGGGGGGGGDSEVEPSSPKVAGKEDVAEALAAAIASADEGPRAAAAAGGAGVRAEGFGRSADDVAPSPPESVASLEDGAVRGRGQWGVKGGYHLRWEFDTMNVDLGGDKISAVEAVGDGGGGGGRWGGRDLYEFFLDQNMFIVAWKGNSPKAEDAVVFVRDEVPR